ncbi:MAG: FAD-dependent oxidoreductase, partial [bacterium]
SCAYQLARRGYRVAIFEAFPEAGGMLRYGIPPFRLPRKVLDVEIEKILELGIELHTSTMVGRDIALEDIKKEYDQVFLGIGAQASVKLNLPGEELPGVFTGLEFLRLVNSGEQVTVGKNVVVVGGGNTATDAARVARRLGASVTILYRRNRAEMPARAEEISNAEEEGVEIQFLAAPREIQSDNGRITSLLCQRMQLGEPDESGRRRPVPLQGETFTLAVDSLIIAVSQQVEWNGLEPLQDARGVSRHHRFRITERAGVLSGGDVEEIGIVAKALAEGRHAAEVMHARFRGLELPPTPDYEIIAADRLHLQVLEKGSKPIAPQRPAAERLAYPWEEASQPITAEQVLAEAARCVNCGESFIKRPKTHPVHVLRRFTQIGVGTLLFNSFWGGDFHAYGVRRPAAQRLLPGSELPLLSNCPAELPYRDVAALLRYPSSPLVRDRFPADYRTILRTIHLRLALPLGARSGSSL